MARATRKAGRDVAYVSGDSVARVASDWEGLSCVRIAGDITLVEAITRSFLASGGRLRSTHAPDTASYSCSRAWVGDWMHLLALPRVEVRVGRQECVFWDQRGYRTRCMVSGQIKRKGVSVNVHCGMWIAAATDVVGYFIAYDYAWHILGAGQLRELVTDMERILAERGAVRLHLTHLM
jgi:hypothetical protein